MTRLNSHQTRYMEVIRDLIADGPVTREDFARAACIGLSNVSSKFRALELKGLVQLGVVVGNSGVSSSDGRTRGSKTTAVVAALDVDGSVLRPETVVYDDVLECFVFAQDRQPVDEVSRKCLRCTAEFLAPSRFVRFCAPCKSTDEWSVGAPSGGYTSNLAAMSYGGVGGFASPESTAFARITLSKRGSP